MKKINILLSALVLALAPSVVQAQSNGFREILSGIVEKNLALKAMDRQVYAEKLTNKSGNYLSDPEIEVARLWSDPSSNPNRTDFSVSQEIDLSVIRGTMRQVSDSRNMLLDLEYVQERLNVQLEAAEALCQLEYCNEMEAVLTERIELYTRVANGYARQLESGNSGRLELNKARLVLAGLESDLRKNRIEKQAVLSTLRSLNGGEEFNSEVGNLQVGEVPADFEQWYNQTKEINPYLTYSLKEIDVMKAEQQVSKEANLPKLKVGYTSELVPGDKYRGVSVGVAIPVWSNANRRKYADAAVLSARMHQADVEVQEKERMLSLYDRAKGLDDVMTSYMEELNTLDNSELLSKALSEGEISFLDYVVEMDMVFNAIDASVEMKRERNMALAELLSISDFQ